MCSGRGDLRSFGHRCAAAEVICRGDPSATLGRGATQTGGGERLASTTQEQPRRARRLIPSGACSTHVQRSNSQTWGGGEAHVPPQPNLEKALENEGGMGVRAEPRYRRPKELSKLLRGGGRTFNPSATPEKALEKPNMGGARLFVPKRALGPRKHVRIAQKTGTRFYAETGLFGAGSCW